MTDEFNAAQFSTSASQNAASNLFVGLAVH
jgi:hypothetical protein